jgi:hypothetical protein
MLMGGCWQKAGWMAELITSMAAGIDGVTGVDRLTCAACVSAACWLGLRGADRIQRHHIFVHVRLRCLPGYKAAASAGGHASGCFVPYYNAFVSAYATTFSVCRGRNSETWTPMNVAPCFYSDVCAIHCVIDALADGGEWLHAPNLLLQRLAR